MDTVILAFNTIWHNFLLQVPHLLLGTAVIIVGVLFANFVERFFRKKINKKSKDPLTTKFITISIKLVFLIAVIIFALKIAGLSGVINLLITSVGASALIIGFAFKDIGENFLAGIIMSFSRPFDLDDTVLIGDMFGKIKNMTFRYTKMKTFDGRDVYIPNSDVLKKPVVNYTEDGFFRMDFEVGVAYEDDVNDAELLIEKTMLQVQGVINNAEHVSYATVSKLDVSTVNFGVFFWVETKDFKREAMKIKGNVIIAVKKALEAGGFNMPADIQELKLYGSQEQIPLLIKRVE